MAWCRQVTSHYLSQCWAIWRHWAQVKTCTPASVVELVVYDLENGCHAHVINTEKHVFWLFKSQSNDAAVMLTLRLMFILANFVTNDKHHSRGWLGGRDPSQYEDRLIFIMGMSILGKIASYIETIPLVWVTWERSHPMSECVTYHVTPPLTGWIRSHVIWDGRSIDGGM